jgi:hypothetical protein
MAHTTRRNPEDAYPGVRHVTKRANTAKNTVKKQNMQVRLSRIKTAGKKK